jgi:hypothetical protein
LSGGNVTGTSSAGGEVTPKQLELLKEILPRVSRVVVLSNQSTALHVTLLEALEAAARTLQVKLHQVDVRSPALRWNSTAASEDPIGSLRIELRPSTIKSLAFRLDGRGPATSRRSACPAKAAVRMVDLPFCGT